MFGISKSVDLCDTLYENFPTLMEYATENKFQRSPTVETYLDYVLYCDYGSCCGDYGKVRELTQNEKNKYRKVFEQIIPNVDMDKVRLVEFCW